MELGRGIKMENKLIVGDNFALRRDDIRRCYVTCQISGFNMSREVTQVFVIETYFDEDFVIHFENYDKVKNFLEQLKD